MRQGGELAIEACHVAPCPLGLGIAGHCRPHIGVGRAFQKMGLAALWFFACHAGHG